MIPEEKLQELLDKQAIYEVLATWSRGLDRGDVEVMASVFHDDAVIWQGGRHYDVKADGANPAQDYVTRHEMFKSHLHFNANQLIEFDGPDAARVETYWMPSIVMVVDGVEKLLQYAGRHLDRLERRNGEWKIAHRVSTFEWRTVVPLWKEPIDPFVFPPMNRLGEMDFKSKDDPLYSIP